MVSLLIFMANAFAADVYEVCIHRKQTWIEREQRFENDYVSTFFSREPIQLIVYENMFEINRDKRKTQKKFKKDNMDCYREHENSFICYDKLHQRFLWEFNKRNGTTTRDVLEICYINGEQI